MWDFRPAVAVAMLCMALATTACLQSPAISCPDDVVCGPGKVCAPEGGCADPEQVTACETLEDNASCTIEGLGDGVCRDSLCVVARCGDGVQDPSEGCDDGNRVDNDECTNACALSSCGDGVLHQDEACDDGTGNGPNAACSELCVIAFCGDGKVYFDGEECDDGAANADSANCTSACTTNVCGDGYLLALGEFCDDGNNDSGDGCRGDCLKIETCGDAWIDQDEDCDDGNDNPADGCDACVAFSWSAAAILGGEADATTTTIAPPGLLAVDRLGNVYFAETGNHRIRRVDGFTGVITTVAGTGLAGDSGDGGPATSAALNQPGGVAIDGLGAVYVADTWNHRIRRVDPQSGKISTVAGSASAGFSGDAGLATLAELNFPAAVAVDGLGNLYISDAGNVRIRRVDSDSGEIDTVAGTGLGCSTEAEDDTGDGGPARLACFNKLTGIALDSQGNVYVADLLNSQVRRLDAASGIITTVAGTGVDGLIGDGGQATAATLNHPRGVAVDAAGNLYVADSLNHRLRTVDASTGIIETFAGIGPDGPASGGFDGDGGQATAAQLNGPTGVGVSIDGHVYFSDSANRRVRWVSADTGDIDTLAGNGGTGDGDTAATSRSMSGPADVAVDSAGNLYIADFVDLKIRRVDASTGLIRTYAGTGVAGYSGDGSAAADAELRTPKAIAIDAAGNVYFAEVTNHVVRRIDATTLTMSTVAGDCTAGFSGDAGDATSAQLQFPQGIAIDGLGNLYIGDSGNHRIRRVAASDGTITTIAGTGTPAWSGDGGDALSAELNSPRGLALDPAGNLLFADSGNHRLRVIDAGNGEISTLAGTGIGGSTGDDSPASAAQLDAPQDVVVDAAGHIYVAEASGDRVRRIDASTGTISTLAGADRPTVTFLGDGGPAADAELSQPLGLGLDLTGNVYVADFGNDLVRRIDRSSGTITTVAGKIDPEGVGDVSIARLIDPRAIVRTPAFLLIAGGTSGTVEAFRESAGLLEVVAGRYPHSLPTASLARYRDQGFGTVGGVAYDSVNSLLYLSETSAHRVHAVNVIDPDDEDSWTIAPFANSGGAQGFAEGAAASAQFSTPTGLYYNEPAETLYVADTENHVIRAIDLSGGAAAATVTTIAGRPQTLGFFGDGGAATSALLYLPQAVTACPNGDLFIADTASHRIRRVASGSQLISTVLGDGIAASSGQGSPSRDFSVAEPLGLACDALGNVYVNSSSTVRLLVADDTGVVDGTGVVQTIYGTQPRYDFPATVTFCLTGLTVVDAQTVQLTDSCTGLLVELSLEQF